MKILREIKAVGLWDWLWFVFVIKRNEFHHSLDSQMVRETVITIRGWRVQIARSYYHYLPGKKRSRAHAIDNKIQDAAANE